MTLDFQEIRSASDFEMFIRELLIRMNMSTVWTGEGIDDGIDLIATEQVKGPISSANKKWLVDCKHFAKSGRSVGVSQVTDIYDRCQKIDANGFLLVCSTRATSGLLKKLKELEAKQELSCLVWDARHLESLVTTPNTLDIAHRFMPISSVSLEWTVYFTEAENRWIGLYKGHHVVLESRSGISPPPLGHLSKIIESVESLPIASNEHIRFRSIWHDTPNGLIFACKVDYLISAGSQPTLYPEDFNSYLIEDCIEGGMVELEVNLQLFLPHSDRFDLNDPSFYTEVKAPLYSRILHMDKVSTKEFANNWLYLKQPPIRSFNDQLMWNNVKAKHGFTKIGDLDAFSVDITSEKT